MVYSIMVMTIFTIYLFFLDKEWFAKSTSVVLWGIYMVIVNSITCTITNQEFSAELIALSVAITCLSQLAALVVCILCDYLRVSGSEIKEIIKSAHTFERRLSTENKEVNPTIELIDTKTLRIRCGIRWYEEAEAEKAIILARSIIDLFADSDGMDYSFELEFGGIYKGKSCLCLYVVRDFPLKNTVLISPLLYARVEWCNFWYNRYNRKRI